MKATKQWPTTRTAMQQLIGNNSKNRLNLLDHHPILKNKRFKGCFIPPFIPSSQLLPHLLFYDPREAYFCGEMPLQRHEKLNQRFSCYILLFLWYLLPFLLVQQCTTRFYEDLKALKELWDDEERKKTDDDMHLFEYSIFACTFLVFPSSEFENLSFQNTHTNYTTPK